MRAAVATAPYSVGSLATCSFATCASASGAHESADEKMSVASKAVLMIRHVRGARPRQAPCRYQRVFLPAASVYPRAVDATDHGDARLYVYPNAAYATQLDARYAMTMSARPRDDAVAKGLPHGASVYGPSRR